MVHCPCVLNISSSYKRYHPEQSNEVVSDNVETGSWGPRRPGLWAQERFSALCPREGRARRGHCLCGSDPREATHTQGFWSNC